MSGRAKLSCSRRGLGRWRVAVDGATLPRVYRRFRSALAAAKRRLRGRAEWASVHWIDAMSYPFWEGGSSRHRRWIVYRANRRLS
jgi:hypothetical protein